MTRIIAGVCAAIALAAGGYALDSWSQSRGSADSANLLDFQLVGAAHAQEASDAETVTIPDMVMGSEDAPVTLIEYASYTCPHCARFHNEVFKQLKTDYIDTGKVKFVYREVYFDRYGLWASMVARCGGQEKFFGITDLIFKGQAEWVRAGGPTEIVGELEKIGRLAGIEGEQLDACMQDAEKAQALVTWYQENAEADDISATPTFMLNGTQVSNQSYDKLKALIDAEL